MISFVFELLRSFPIFVFLHYRVGKMKTICGFLQETISKMIENRVFLEAEVQAKRKGA